MDTRGTINADIAAIENAERQLRALSANSRENPDLRGAEEDSAQAERLERWMPDLTLPDFRRTCLTELRSYRGNQLHQETRGQSTSKVSLKVHDTLMRQCRVVAEKNPHLFNDSKEFIDDFALLGINIGLYAFRRYPNAEDVIEPLSMEDEEVMKSLYLETQRNKILIQFEDHCRRAQESAYHMENDLHIPNSIKITLERVMTAAESFAGRHPYHKAQYSEVVERYFGPQAWKQFRDKLRKRELRSEDRVETEGDPTLISSKRHLSLVSTQGSE